MAGARLCEYPFVPITGRGTGSRWTAWTAWKHPAGLDAGGNERRRSGATGRCRIDGMDDKLTLTFDEHASADAIKDLQLALREVSPKLDVKRLGADGKYQDFGTIILLLLGTPFAVQIAKKVGDWIVKHKSTTLTIRRPDGGSITMTNLSAKEASGIVELFVSRREPTF